MIAKLYNKPLLPQMSHTGIYQLIIENKLITDQPTFSYEQRKRA